MSGGLRVESERGALLPSTLHSLLVRYDPDAVK
jgi:hypothetical protein